MPVSVLRTNLLLHTFRVKIYLQRERQFCLFTGEVFLGPKKRTGRGQTFTLFMYIENSTKMKKLILMSLLTMATGHAVAVGMCDYSSSFTVSDSRNDDVRREIGLDCSIPDFDTDRIDGNVIGRRLARILQRLSEKYMESPYNGSLAGILREQDPRVLFAYIEKMKIRHIRKSGNQIVITIALTIKKNTQGIRHPDIALTFTDGVSESTATNDLFRYICRYIKE